MHVINTDANNPQNRNLPDEYLNVSVAREIELPNLTFLESIASIEQEDAQGDVIDALVVAMHLINGMASMFSFVRLYNR